MAEVFTEPKPRVTHSISKCPHGLLKASACLICNAHSIRTEPNSIQVPVKSGPEAQIVREKKRTTTSYRKGFVALRRGLLDHLKQRRLSLLEFALFMLLVADADPRTGICFTSAGLLAELYGSSRRTARDCLEKLEKKRYIRRFPTRGKHGSYPILIDKYLCTDGAINGKYLNATKSKTYSHLVYEARHESVEDVELCGNKPELGSNEDTAIQRDDNAMIEGDI